MTEVDRWKAVAARCLNAVRSIQLFYAGKLSEGEAAACIEMTLADAPPVMDWLSYRDAVILQQHTAIQSKNLFMTRAALRKIAKLKGAGPEAVRIATEALAKIERGEEKKVN